MDDANTHLKASKSKPMMLTFIADDIEGRRLYKKENGVDNTPSPLNTPFLRMKAILFMDQGDYLGEIPELLNKSYYP
ncbi:MAG: hypothetical protein QGF78_05185 [Candidatus Bathyarchaeota archaeon]|jgi:hypothetical protein|nr:hypothetical protein [Candidatus Bathyarchaeota archaeon]